MRYNDFTEMPIWNKAMDVAVAIFDLTKNLPRTEDYGLTSQIRRSAESISANIAEGFGRYHKKDKIKFYYYSFGSVKECLDWDEKAKVRELISEENYIKIFETLQSLPKELHQLINFTNERLKI